MSRAMAAATVGRASLLCWAVGASSSMFASRGRQHELCCSTPLRHKLFRHAQCRRCSRVEAAGQPIMNAENTCLTNTTR